ncbi:MAG: EamA family transporter [Patescibacteria group bacterium]
MNIAILLAFGAMVGWGLGDFLSQKVIHRIGWLETLWWIYLASFIGLLPLIWRDLWVLNWPGVSLLLILGVIDFAGAMAHFKALETGKLSVVEIILFFELPITIILGVMFLQNTLSPDQLLLIFGLFVGVILISLDFNKMRWHQFWFFWQKNKIFLERGAWLAALTAILLALTNFFTALGSVRVTPLLAIWFPWSLSGLVCLTYFLLRGKFGAVIKHSRQHWPWILASAVVDIIAWLFFAFSMSEKGELAIVAAVTEGYIVIAMLLGLKFNKEKIRGWQYLGAAITIICSLTIGFTSG